MGGFPASLLKLRKHKRSRSDCAPTRYAHRARRASRPVDRPNGRTASEPRPARHRPARGRRHRSRRATNPLPRASGGAGRQRGMTTSLSRPAIYLISRLWALDPATIAGTPEPPPFNARSGAMIEAQSVHLQLRPMTSPAAGLEDGPNVMREIRLPGCAACAQRISTAASGKIRIANILSRMPGNDASSGNSASRRGWMPDAGRCHDTGAGATRSIAYTLSPIRRGRGRCGRLGQYFPPAFAACRLPSSPPCAPRGGPLPLPLSRRGLPARAGIRCARADASLVSENAGAGGRRGRLSAGWRGRSFGVVKQAAKGFERASGEVAHTVIQRGGVFCAGPLHGGFEVGLVAQPVMRSWIDGYRLRGPRQ